jgi:hypothetical protein
MDRDRKIAFLVGAGQVGRYKSPLYVKAINKKKAKLVIPKPSPHTARPTWGAPWNACRRPLTPRMIASIAIGKNRKNGTEITPRTKRLPQRRFRHR